MVIFEFLNCDLSCDVLYLAIAWSVCSFVGRTLTLPGIRVVPSNFSDPRVKRCIASCGLVDVQKRNSMIGCISRVWWACGWTRHLGYLCHRRCARRCFRLGSGKILHTCYATIHLRWQRCSDTYRGRCLGPGCWTASRRRFGSDKRVHSMRRLRPRCIQTRWGCTCQPQKPPRTTRTRLSTTAQCRAESTQNTSPMKHFVRIQSSKFELVLTRRATAYTSSRSLVVLVYL